MNDTLAAVLIIYGIGFTFFLFICGFMIDSPKWRTRRPGARMAFFIPAWPILLAYWAFDGFVRLWDKAEWRKN